MNQEKLYWPIEKLRDWYKNPRAIKKEDFGRLKKQISQLGQYKPLVVNSGKYWGEEGMVAGGNMRIKAYRELGIKDIWVSLVDPKTEAEFIRYALSDNDRAGYYIEEQLAQLVTEFGVEISIDDFKIDLGEPITLTDLLNRFSPDPEEDEPPAIEEGEPLSKYGEVYQLGNHRLMCGDATKIEDVEKLMDGQKADMVFTDPPYGVNYEGKTKDKLKIKNDETTEIFGVALPNFITVSKLGTSFYVCCPAGNNFKDFLLAFEKYCYQSSTIVWVKNSMVLGHGDYHYKHEPILYGWVKDGAHKFYGDRSQTTVWEINRPSVSKEHPTMKPVRLVARAISNSSKQGDIILDLFGGSGSTLVAAAQLNRLCYIMELDPRYCDVIRKRYSNLTEKGADQ